MRLAAAVIIAVLPAVAAMARPAPVGGPGVEALPAVACDRADDFTYEGSSSCKKCHFKEFKSWVDTKMAKAFEALKPGAKADEKTKAGLDPQKDYTKDATCVACHTTGYGKPGGYPPVDREWTAEEKDRAAAFEGVGCEACHGPGEKASPYKKDHKEYRWADVAKLGMIHPDGNLCATCHNKESPTYQEFKFEDKIGKDTHEILKLKADHGCDHAHR